MSKRAINNQSSSSSSSLSSSSLIENSNQPNKSNHFEQQKHQNSIKMKSSSSLIIIQSCLLMIVISFILIITLVSSSKINDNRSLNNDNKPVKPGETPIKIKLHAWSVIIGWIGCISSSIILAKCTGDFWTNRKLFGISLWFRLHQFTAIGGLFFNSLGMIVIILHARKLNTNRHAIFGFVATILITLQALIGLFLRPKPNSRYRQLFNYGHWFCGHLSHSLALMNILISAKKKSQQFLWLFISFMFIYLIFTDLLRKLDLNRLCFERRSNLWQKLSQYSTFLLLFVIFSLTISMVITIF